MLYVTYAVITLLLALRIEQICISIGYPWAPNITFTRWGCFVFQLFSTRVPATRVGLKIMGNFNMLAENAYSPNLYGKNFALFASLYAE